MAAIDDISISFSKPEDNPEISVISVRGFVDTTTSGELEESLKRLLKQGQYSIVVDLGGVNYISSAGWGIFISEIKEIRENGGDLKLASMIGEVYEVFELLEFQTILESFDSIDEAVTSFGSPTGNNSKDVEEPAESDEEAEVKSTPEN
jgi:anti-sigma B factor antagonist